MAGTAPWLGLPKCTKTTLRLPVCQRADGSDLALTLLVAIGNATKPLLLLIGGVHGDEYEGPTALWEFFESVNPKTLDGTVLMLPVANPPAFAAGNRVNPDDPKDLARTFPGSATGSITEQIAHVIYHQLMARAQFLCDFHSAGRNYRIDPWAGYAVVSDPSRLQYQRWAANLVGYPTVWGTPMKPGRSLSAADELGIPAIYVEAPGEGRVHREDVKRNLFAIHQLLRFLHMIDETVQPTAPDLVVEDTAPDAGHLQIQMVARHGGMFQPEVELGKMVEANQVFGHIVDLAGATREIVRARHAGRVVFLRTFPVVAPGDSLGAVLAGIKNKRDKKADE